MTVVLEHTITALSADEEAWAEVTQAAPSLATVARRCPVQLAVSTPAGDGDIHERGPAVLLPAPCL